MTEILIVLLSLLLGVSYADAPVTTAEVVTTTQTSAPMPVDELFEWVQEVQAVLEDISPNWYLSYVNNGESFTQAAWIESCCLGVVALHETRFTTASAIPDYFDYENDMLAYYAWSLTNYAPYELKQSCEVNGIRIHLFKGTTNGEEYYIRHFHQEDGLNTLNTGLYFRSLEELDYYSQLLFPDLTCPPQTDEESL